MRRHGRDSDDFNPTIAVMFGDLETRPKDVGETKHGKLADARGYVIRFRGVEWRAVYVCDEATRTVRVVSFTKHDEAYREATRRI